MMNDWVSPGKLSEKYKLESDGLIGQGSYAQVVRAKEISSGRSVAVKIIKKQKMNAQEELLLEKEVYIMRNISHPNIVEFYDCYTDAKHIYLVLEYLSGGELYDEICEKDSYSEEQAREIIGPLIDAVRYLHECGIVHRDIKPQNCVYSSRGQNRTLKIIDFGVSQIIPDDTHLLSSAVGTPLYMAPEILSGMKYDKQADWWAIGVILYVLLTGYPPFQSQDEAHLKEEIFALGVKFEPEDWKNISQSAKDLVSKLLAVSGKQRIGGQDIMEHPWMVSEIGLKELPKVQENLTKFSSKIKNMRNAVRIMQANNK